MGKTQNKTNPVEDFNDGNKFQISKISTFQKYTGTKTRKMEPGTNSYYTTTRVSQDGKDDKGNIIYKREVILFDSKEKMKAFEDLGSANKSQLGANGGGVVIATGSTEKGKKTFELTEAGADQPDQRFEARKSHDAGRTYPLQGQ